MNCPNCGQTNEADTNFCCRCGTSLRSLRFAPESPVSSEKTLTQLRFGSDFSAGTLFAARYQLIEELGTGGMGRVFKALDTEIGEKVALKLIRPEIADEILIERFRNELKLARKIRHKNVCQMFDLGKASGQYYITMEFVAGEDLRNILRMSKSVSLASAVDYAAQICEGLSEAHRMGVVHRDLKPANIMIDKDGAARIMDFGIAHSAQSGPGTMPGMMVGTPAYMSPEQAEGRPADARSDLYSLGIMLYEMTTGRVPFEGDTALALALKHKSDRPIPPTQVNAEISAELGRAIERCLEKNPARRYQNAAELLADLKAVAGTWSGVAVKTAALRPRTTSLAEREIKIAFTLRKAVLPAAVLAAVILGIIFIPKLAAKKGGGPAPPSKIDRSLALISFENQTGDKAFDYLQKAIPNLLITSLEQTGTIHVMTWERMRDVLKQMGKDDIDLVDRDLGFEVCRREGIRAIVLGSFVKAENMFVTDAKVLDVGTKGLIRTVGSKGDGPKSILERQIDELSRGIAQAVGRPDQAPPATGGHIADVMTASLDAYHAYLRGTEDYYKFYFEDARKYLEQAVALDPGFASAHLYLARAAIRLDDTKTHRSALQKAMALAGKATAKEKLYIEAAYAGAIERDPNKKLELLRRIAERFPSEKQCHYDLGAYFAEARKFRESIAEYQKALTLDPRDGYAMNHIAFSYADLGDYDRALEFFERYVSVAPNDANPLDSIGELYLKMGRLDEAIAKYEQALVLKPGFGSDWKIAYIRGLQENYGECRKRLDTYIEKGGSPGLKALGRVWKGFLAYWLGDFAGSIKELEAASGIFKSAGDEAMTVFGDGLKGWIYEDHGDLVLSRAIYKDVNERIRKYWLPAGFPISIDAKFTYALADLKEGRLDSAKAALSEIQAVSKFIGLVPSGGFFMNWLNAYGDYLQAEMSLVQGSPAEAISICEKSRPPAIPTIDDVLMLVYNLPFTRDVQARAFLQNGQPDKAIAVYERQTSLDPAVPDRRWINPKDHFRLAVLYEKMGLKEKAVARYEKFLALWKDAPASAPEKAEALKRLASLKK